MLTRAEIYALADRLAAASPGAVFDAAEARLCAEALRRLADDETRFEVATLIEQATGQAWHDPKIMAAATKIADLYRAA